MANAIKERQEALIQEHLAGDPDFYEGRKLLRNLLTIFVIEVAVYSISQFAFILLRNASLRTFDYVVLFFPTLISLAGAYMIYCGIKRYGDLPLAGGAYSLYSAYANGMFTNFMRGDLLYKIYVSIFIIAAIIQISVFIYIKLNKKCSYYCDEMLSILKEVNKFAMPNK